MEKITKTFKNGEVLYAEDLNPIVNAVNQNTDDVAALKEAVKGAGGMVIENVKTGTIEAQSNHYYNVAEDVEALELTLPTPTEGKADVVKVHFFAGQSLSMSVDGGEHPVIYTGAALKPRWEYVLTFSFDGAKWNATSESLTPGNCLVFQSDSKFALSIKYRERTRLIEYSTDGFNWNTAGEDSIPAANNGRKYIVLVRGRGNADAPYISMNAQSVVDCLGDARNLLDFTIPDSIQLAEYCFNEAFSGCTSLRTAPELPATTLARSCYASMFSDCTNLVQAPALPATTLAVNCYTSMFYGCTSLAQAPALPAITLAVNCYASMFSDCTGLVQAPALPATTLAEGCYNEMFYGCTSLAQAPALPATILENYCYAGMFNGCISLVQAPELPATALANRCYNGMFLGCTSLVNAPELPAAVLTDYCYENMFAGCAQLNKITMLATDIAAANCLNSWVQGVAATGSLVKNPAMTTLPTGTSGIPDGWTVEDYVG